MKVCRTSSVQEARYKLIESLEIKQIPCFGSSALPLHPIAQITLVYGPNGSGKSSIARAMEAANNPGFQHELFNKDFIDRLLQVDQGIPGVFVIRDGAPEVQERIDALVGVEASESKPAKPGEIRDAERTVEQYEKSIEKQEGLLSEADQVVLEASWKKRVALPSTLQQAFEGYKSDKKKHLAEVHRVRSSTSSDSLKSETALLDEYTTLDVESGDDLKRIPLLPRLGSLSPAQSALLQEEIKSQDNTTFGEFVQQLQNADWVHEGQSFLDQSQGKCPFCQQALPSDVTDSLSSLFDHHYEEQVTNLEKIRVEEEQRLDTLNTYLASLSAHEAPEIKEIERFGGVLSQKIRSRIAQVGAKIKSPSQSVEFEAISETVDEIERIVTASNTRIDETNLLLRNKKQAKSNLKKEVWRYYVHSVLEQDLSFFEGSVTNPKKALDSLRPKLEDAQEKLASKRSELSELQQQLTSSLPTVQDMNKTLRNLGFLSFTIQHSQDDTYQLIRPDGSAANHTLSEGERTLISFLYFFHRIKQMHEDRTVSDQLVVIIDDPVSSLDGEMLFVINLLIRKLLGYCVKEDGRTRQIILLTHNAYFFKEAEFTPNGMSPGKRSYFVLSKGPTGITSHRHYEKSPIKSNYRQLWDQVKAANNAQDLELSASLPNAMRRIIENYFQITGGIDVDDVISKIDEADRWASHALLAWYNDGSHTAPWDVDYASISSDVSTHLRAFKQLFDAAGHSPHYEMMMADETQMGVGTSN
ncbi:AAA family ATPase [Leucobacter massiliensis]|uniref:AAA family ATPase n=1 Tax=Leucobacter massiliensis TaxID=1686285 RepID=UPI0026C70763